MTKQLLAIGVALFALAFHATDVRAEESAQKNAVTFFAIVDPNTFETSLTATIGETQVTPQQLSDAIRSGSDQVLRITSVHGSLFSARGAPAAGSYALAFIGACSERFSVRGFGNGYLALGGADTLGVTYRPGLVASLNRGESLCFRSLVQSNQRVMLEVHGYLQKRD
ncbi:MAG: hypothetical protein AAFO81_08380 [Pseudomonadota bacterium]